MPMYEYYCQDCEKNFDVKATIHEKEKGLNVVCPYCKSSKTLQVFGNFFTPAGKGGSFNGGCGSNSKPGCCG